MKNKENIWIVVSPDRSFVQGIIYESKSAAEEAIQWDFALSGCIAIPATLNY